MRAEDQMTFLVGVAEVFLDTGLVFVSVYHEPQGWEPGWVLGGERMEDSLYL